MPFIVLLIIIGVTFIGGGIAQKIQQDKQSYLITPTVTPTLTPIPSISPTQTANQTNNQTTSTLGTTTDQLLPTFDPDPIINCIFPHSGEKQMRKSQCNNAIDCQIGGAWYIYPSKESCNEDQNKYKQTYIDNLKKELEKKYSNQEYTIPTLQPLPTFQLPTSPPHPTYDFSYLYKELETIKNETLNNMQKNTIPTTKPNNCKEIRNTGLYDCEANSLRPL